MLLGRTSYRTLNLKQNIIRLSVSFKHEVYVFIVVYITIYDISDMFAISPNADIDKLLCFLIHQHSRAIARLNHQVSIQLFYYIQYIRHGDVNYSNILTVLTSILHVVIMIEPLLFC